MEAVRLTIVQHDPVSVNLCDSVRAAWVKGGRLSLWNFLHFAVKLRSRRLVEARCLVQAKDADRLEQTQRAQPINIRSVFRSFKAYLNMALGRQIVDLCGLDALHQPDQVRRVCHVPVVEVEVRIRIMRVADEVVDPSRVE